MVKRIFPVRILNRGNGERRPTTNLSMGYVPQAALLLQKLNACFVDNLEKYLASGHPIDCHTLDAALKPFMKKAIDRNILKSPTNIQLKFLKPNGANEY
ncbi:hypothetical protein TNIN_486541 [Trichonephila inaurata madagascariensis]|uniref:Uncharacterized protein n=1 Tax=Trichonephila inaurata madagascariensis TaxID=2747483 RepID=A0A8X6Y6Q0_9ARAC|nr:hypothetical protein TNIN_486541 [Trichonephila inaurata madagascariensis]